MGTKLYERLIDCVRILFKDIGCEIVKCKDCDSKRVGLAFKKKGDLVIKAYKCKNCDREFWSEEKILNKKPKWYK